MKTQTQLNESFFNKLVLSVEWWNDTYEDDLEFFYQDNNYHLTLTGKNEVMIVSREKLWKYIDKEFKRTGDTWRKAVDRAIDYVNNDINTDIRCLISGHYRNWNTTGDKCNTGLGMHQIQLTYEIFVGFRYLEQYFGV